MNKPKWDAELKPHLSDYILECFRAGLDRDQSYWACTSYLLLKNKDERQTLANTIAQLHSMNVFAKGRIPKEAMQ